MIDQHDHRSAQNMPARCYLVLVLMTTLVTNATAAGPLGRETETWPPCAVACSDLPIDFERESKADDRSPFAERGTPSAHEQDAPKSAATCSCEELERPRYTVEPAVPNLLQSERGSAAGTSYFALVARLLLGIGWCGGCLSGLVWLDRQTQGYRRGVLIPATAVTTVAGLLLLWLAL